MKYRNLMVLMGGVMLVTFVIPLVTQFVFLSPEEIEEAGGQLEFARQLEPFRELMSQLLGVGIFLAIIFTLPLILLMGGGLRVERRLERASESLGLDKEKALKPKELTQSQWLHALFTRDQEEFEKLVREETEAELYEEGVLDAEPDSYPETLRRRRESKRRHGHRHPTSRRRR